MKWKLSDGTCVFSILEHTCKWDGTRNFSVIIQNVFVLKQNTSVKSRTPGTLRTRPKRQIYVQCVSPLSSLFYRDFALHWRPNWRHGVIKSNHQPHHCLFNRLFRLRSRKTSKLRVTGLCAGNSPATGEFPAQMASNAENGSTWWRHHGCNYVHNGIWWITQ